MLQFCLKNGDFGTCMSLVAAVLGWIRSVVDEKSTVCTIFYADSFKREEISCDGCRGNKGINECRS